MPNFQKLGSNPKNLMFYEEKDQALSRLRGKSNLFYRIQRFLDSTSKAQARLELDEIGLVPPLVCSNNCYQQKHVSIRITKIDKVIVRSFSSDAELCLIELDQV